MRRLPAALLAALALAPGLVAQAVLDAPESSVRFASGRATFWLDRTAVVPFFVEAAAEEDRTLPARVDDAACVEIVRPPEVLAGERRGSLRVRALAAGRTTLHVAGAALPVEVRAPSASARLFAPRPTIVAPVQGAAVWGTFAVGVELSPCALDGAPPELALELPGGRRLEPTAVRPPDGGATLRARFDVDAADLAPGPNTLRVRVDGEACDDPRARRTVDVVRPGDALLVGECEDALDLPRPDAFGRGVPRVGSGSDASGGRFVVAPRPNPRWVLPVTVEETGRHQLLLTVRGDLAGGAFPSIGLEVDTPNPVLGATRVVDHRWHRVPVGPPLELEAGERTLAIRYLNELNVGARADRALYLDRWELCRLDAPGVEGAGDADATSMAMRMEPRLRGGASLWLGLERPLDGLAMNGRLSIVGHANWSGAPDSAAPRVELVVDGAVLATQQSARPSFALDRAHLGPGEHDLLLRATLPGGTTAETPVQRLRVPGPVADGPARDLHRFDVLDERWDGLAGVLDQQGEEARQRVARPTAPLDATLELPADLAGSFQLVAEARGPGNDGAPGHVRAVVEQGDVAGDPLAAEVRHWWRARELGRVELAPGPKRVRLRLEPRAEGPQLRLRALALRTVDPGPDRTPPVARLAYPADGHVAHGVDAVVVEAFDERRLASADVVLDGRPQATFGDVPPGAGAVVLPLLLRDVAPGEHTLAVRVVDTAGNVGETAPIRVTVAAEPPAEPGPYERAVHLLNRLAYGPEPAELAELLVRGEDAWLHDALYGDRRGDLAARDLAAARLGDAIAYQADRLALSAALRTDDPVRARFVLWVDDHFSTWAGKTGAPSEWAEHAEFARLGFAPFPELLHASATSPTMLVYLDQPRSYAGRLNENYARELLELHTVGVDGGYTQEEVTDLARLLAGLTVAQEAPVDGSGAYQRRVLRFDPDLSDGRALTVLGRRFPATPASGRFDRFRELLELLAAQPATARFVATKLAEHYVDSPAPEPLVDHLAAAYLAHGGDPRPMLEALVAHEAFWRAADEPRLADPLDYGLRVARATGVTAVDWSLRGFLQNSGMGLFDRVTPDGYPDEGEAWADTNGLLQRWRWVQGIPWAIRVLVPNEARRYGGGDPLAWRQRVVDHAAVRLTGRTLGAESNAAALEFLETSDEPHWQRVDRLTLLVCRLPEANLK